MSSSWTFAIKGWFLKDIGATQNISFFIFITSFRQVLVEIAS